MKPKVVKRRDPDHPVPPMIKKLEKGYKGTKEYKIYLAMKKGYDKRQAALKRLEKVRATRKKAAGAKAAKRTLKSGNQRSRAKASARKK